MMMILDSPRARRVFSISLLVVASSLSSTLAPSRPPRGVQFGPNIMLAGASNYEPAIAADPLDQNHLVAGFFENTKSGGTCHTALTTDGGLTWNPGGSPPRLAKGNVCTDVSLGADLLGNVYLAFIGNQDQLQVAKSTDGGKTFPAASSAASGQDKPYMAVDAQAKSPFRGRIYAAYQNFFSLPGWTIDAVTSSDGGTTWSVPVSVGAASPSFPFVDGSLPVVAPDGTVYVFYIEFDTGALGKMNVMFSASGDGGGTWGQPTSVATGLPSPGYFQLRNAAANFETRTGLGFRSSSFPAAAIAPDGTMFVAWIDFPQGSCNLIGGNGEDPCTNSDVRLSVSRNGGKTWTAPVKVSDETNPSDQFNPWMAVHPDGLLSIVWLDKRLDPKNVNFDAFYTNTYDGATFLPNIRVSSATSLVGRTAFVGDYIGIATTTNGVFPVWDDLRSGQNSIFTATGVFAP